MMQTRGSRRSPVDRRDAVFHAWDDPTKHATYRLRHDAFTGGRTLMGGWTDGRMGRCIQALLVAIGISSVDRLSAQNCRSAHPPIGHPTIDSIIIETATSSTTRTRRPVGSRTSRTGCMCGRARG